MHRKGSSDRSGTVDDPPRGGTLIGRTFPRTLSSPCRCVKNSIARALRTRRQVRSVIQWEAALVAVLGAVMGVALGIAFGWVAVRAVSTTAFAGFRVPAPQLLANLGVVGVAGMLAGPSGRGRERHLRKEKGHRYAPPSRTDLRVRRSARTALSSCSNASSLIPGCLRSVKTTSLTSCSAITRMGL